MAAFDKLSSFACFSPSDCAPKDFVCKLPFAPMTEALHETGETVTRFSYNLASMQCESFASALPSSADKTWTNQFDSLEECEGCQLVKADFESSHAHAPLHL